MLVVFLLMLLALSVFIVVRIIRNKKNGQENAPKQKTITRTTGGYAQILATGKELGFSTEDIAFLNELASEAGLQAPYKYFWSCSELDAVLKAFCSVAASSETNDQSNLLIMEKLLERRKTLALTRADSRHAISSTRAIKAGQQIQVILNEIGIFSTHVVKNAEELEILSPIVADLPPTFSFTNRTLNVFFRRRGDGEYSFNTTASKELENKETGDFVLYLAHSDTLARAQKRRSIRIQIQKDAHLYPSVDMGQKDFSEGKKCVINDISDTGCSVIIEGRYTAPPSTIIQFTLCNKLLSIHGDRRAVRYNRQKNISLLHIEFQTIAVEAKNLILAFIFGILDDSTGSVAAAQKTQDAKSTSENTPVPPPPAPPPESAEATYAALAESMPSFDRVTETKEDLTSISLSDLLD